MRSSLVVGFLMLTLAGCSASPSGPATTYPTAPPVSTTMQPGEPPATLVAVLDGDSIRVSVDGTEEEVRLAGLNTPERDECFGDEARSALAEMLEAATTLWLEHPGEEDRDQFDRLLRYVYADGTLVNLALIEAGDALALQTGHPLEADFKRAEGAAWEAGRGMWSPDACGASPPSGLVIDGVEYDPPGRDYENADEESVHITNTGPDPIDLSGWQLRDESTQHRYRFPDGTTLAAGDTIEVRSGCGPDRPGSLGWCAGDAVWSNGGDTALLLTPNGAVAARFVYPGDY